MKTEELLTVAEIREAWKISKSHALTFLKPLHGYKIGRSLRYRKADVEQHLEKFKTKKKS